MNTTEQLAEEQKGAADAANKEAAAVLATVDSLQMPTIDTDALMDDAELIVKGANDAAEKARKQGAENKPIGDEAERVRVEADYEFQRAQVEQQVTVSRRALLMYSPSLLDWSCTSRQRLF